MSASKRPAALDDGPRSKIAASDSRCASPSAEADPVYSFRNPDFEHSGGGTYGKKKYWKTINQIESSERQQATDKLAITYSSIDAVPSFTPARKYSDISGLISNYTDPKTGIQFASAEEYRSVKQLPQDAVKGYLGLRTIPNTGG